MKRIYMAALMLVILNSLLYSQGKPVNHHSNIIDPYPLLITSTKTTSLIFPYAIRSVDRGSRDVLAQKALGVENILFVKADKANFIQTNLSVITADGNFYSFLLDYEYNPCTLNISFINDTVLDKATPTIMTGSNEATIRLLAERIAKVKRTITDFRSTKYMFDLRLLGIYIKDDIVYFKIELQNRSSINYDIEMLRFFIRDEIKLKRTASQEVEIQPLLISGDTSVVRYHSSNTIVYALPKFTIPDRKFLSIQLAERSGGRHLHLSVRNRSIVKAKLVNESQKVSF